MLTATSMCWGMFLFGAGYGIGITAFVEAMDRRVDVRHRWHRLPNAARIALTVVWPLSACWFFTDRGRG